MSRNSVTGRFRDIEISFGFDGDCTVMEVRNLTNNERQVRVMYQKLAVSGLANWKQFQLISSPVSFRLPAEVLEAYRLTFFVDKADPISARLEKILAELEVLKAASPAEESVEDLESIPDTSLPENRSDDDDHATQEPEIESAQQAEEVSPPRATEQVEEAVPSIPQMHVPEPTVSVPHESEQRPKDESRPPRVARKILSVQSVKTLLPNIDTNLEFKITVPTLPESALAARRKSQAIANAENDSSTAWGPVSKRKKKGIFGQFVQVLGISTGGRRGKAYYEQKSEAVQNEFQDQLAKLERDYSEGYGLSLVDWDPETLCEEETAVLLLNLMVNEVRAWQKEVGRATPETEQFVQTLGEINTRLRQTLKQTRGISTPSPTLFPDLLAANQSDLEKIQSECDAYLQRFKQKLTEQEKKHAAKIEVLIFKKFLIEFVRDFLFVEIAKSLPGNEAPERLKWFLDLVDSEVMPIEVGKTEVSPNHHKVKGACISEFEPGTIAEVVTPGLQSKDGKRVNHMAVVIEAE